MSRMGKDTKMSIVVAALVVFAGYYFVIGPQASELSVARSDRERVEQSVREATSTLDAEREGAGAPISPVDDGGHADAVPSEPGVAELLRELQALAGETAMTHSSISPSAITSNPVGPGGSMQIAITASGSREAARAYLRGLNVLERLVVIEQIGLHANADGSVADLQLAIRVFTRRGPAGAA